MNKKDTREMIVEVSEGPRRERDLLPQKRKIWLDLDKENDEWQPINKMWIIKDKKDII